MKCIQCDKEMMLISKDISEDHKNSKKYDREIYWCEAEDLWIRIEKPKKSE